MKRRIRVLAGIALLGVLIVPALNLLSVPKREAIQWDRAFLFNMDFAAGLLARLLYPIGISTDPEQVVVGREGWLYLGDRYSQLRSESRRHPAEHDFETGRTIGKAAEAWAAYFERHDVRLFRVLIGPNKESIYPEYLPTWAAGAVPNVTDALFSGTGPAYIDPRAALRAAKAARSDIPLYYRTDTHWNFLGAGLAFQEFARQIGPAAPEIVWPSPETYALEVVRSRTGGDLANFLRIARSLSDTELLTKAQSAPVDTAQIDFDTGEVLRSGGNPEVQSPSKPLLVRSGPALNDKKVLWLRDSFGTALAPLMAATFREVLQLHWGEAIRPGGRLVQLLEDWKPDYVFFTVVERDARSAWFAALPPPDFLRVDREFAQARLARASNANDLVFDVAQGRYQIVGGDPFIEFDWAAAGPRYLGIELWCEDGSPSVPVQLFWRDRETSFDEQLSARFSFRPGRRLLDLHSLPAWRAGQDVARIRLDVDAVGFCARFSLQLARSDGE